MFTLGHLVMPACGITDMPIVPVSLYAAADEFNSAWNRACMIKNANGDCYNIVPSPAELVKRMKAVLELFGRTADDGTSVVNEAVRVACWNQILLAQNGQLSGEFAP